MFVTCVVQAMATFQALQEEYIALTASGEKISKASRINRRRADSVDDCGPGPRHSLGGALYLARMSTDL